MASEGLSFRRVAVSLSPMKYRPPAPPKENAKRSNNNSNHDTASNSGAAHPAPRCSLAMNDTETILVSASGDVLVCRCREMSSPYLRGDIISRRTKANLRQWWEPDCDALTNHLGEVALASPCCGNHPPMNSQQRPLTPGLRGGSGPVVQSVPQNDNNHNITRRLLGDLPPKTSSESLEEKKYEGDSAEEEAVLNNERLGMMVPNLLDGEIEVLFPLPSFDYSHFADGGNDMIPSSQQRLDASRRQNRLESVPENGEGDTPKHAARGDHHHPDLESLSSPANSEVNATPAAWHATLYTPDFFHGVPVFHPAFSQIRITQVSANPFGSHVLLISREALLFAYGLNNHGQLGNGQRNKVSGADRGFITTPILVTPLLENGGKAITCAAGKNHSLVVVMTEGRRVGRLRQRTTNSTRDSASDVAYEMSRRASSGSRLRVDAKRGNEDENDSLMHHQLYGFGSNKYMKLGLLNPGKKYANDQEDVLLPRRVALHCNVWPDANDGGSMPSYGIFDIAASCDHSAALVRRATGDIELYTWGNGTFGALGLPGSQMRLSAESLAANGSSHSVVTKKTSNTPMNGTRAKEDVVVHSKAVAPIPTLVTSLSYIPGKESSPHYLQLTEFPTSISLGTTCSFVVTSRGRCLSFGSSETGMLGLGPGTTKSIEPFAISFPVGSSRSGRIACIKTVSAGARHVVAQSTEGSAFAWGNTSFKDDEDHSDYGTIAWQPERVQVPVKSGPVRPNLLPTPDGKSRVKVAHVCAGLDATMLVTDSGEVLSYGRMSGQLGLGELRSDVLVPRPMLGGLRLWHNQDKVPQRKASNNATGGSIDNNKINFQQ